MTVTDKSSLFLGALEERTLIAHNKAISIAQASGNLLYAAAAHKLNGANSSIFARIGKNYPASWIASFESSGIDCDPLVRIEKDLDHRSFTALSDELQAQHKNPISQFAKLKMALPKSLLDYQYSGGKLDDRKVRSEHSWREDDLPANVGKFEAAHLCPHDFLSHRLIPGALREAGLQMITLESRATYMQPEFHTDLPELVNGLNAFLTSEIQLNTLFTDQKIDIWQKAAFLGDFNCDCVVIERFGKGHYVYVSADKARYKIPAYPAPISDPSFSGSSFSGAYLAALLDGKDALEAALYGAAAMSVAIQGYSPFYILDSYSGLTESRKNSLAQAVKQI